MTNEEIEIIAAQMGVLTAAVTALFKTSDNKAALREVFEEAATKMQTTHMQYASLVGPNLAREFITRLLAALDG